MKTELSWVPYQLPFNPDVVRVQLLVSQPCIDILEPIS
jgi:hypothetical protein